MTTIKSHGFLPLWVPLISGVHMCWRYVLMWCFEYLITCCSCILYVAHYVLSFSFKVQLMSFKENKLMSMNVLNWFNPWGSHQIYPHFTTKFLTMEIYPHFTMETLYLQIGFVKIPWLINTICLKNCKSLHMTLFHQIYPHVTTKFLTLEIYPHFNIETLYLSFVKVRCLINTICQKNHMSLHMTLLHFF